MNQKIKQLIAREKFQNKILKALIKIKQTNFKMMVILLLRMHIKILRNKKTNIL